MILQIEQYLFKFIYMAFQFILLFHIVSCYTFISFFVTVNFHLS